jgi:hypothetical protein
MSSFVLAFAFALSCLAPLAVHAHGYVPPATVTISVDTGGGEPGFQTIVYVQNVKTGDTASYAIAPHSKPLLVYIAEPGTYVFYGRLVEAMDDYFFGATGVKSRSTPVLRPLLALDIELGKEYQVLINDRSVQLPVKGKPVTVPWRR